MSTGPLRIVHGVLNLDVGGLERFVISLAEQARANGHTVMIICVDRPGTLADQANHSGIEVHCLHADPARRKAAIPKACELLRSLQPDLLHTHQVGAANVLGEAARSLAIPVIHTEHGNAFQRGRGWLHQLKLRILYQRTARLLEHWVCVSDEIRKALARWKTVPSAKLQVMPNGVSLVDTFTDRTSTRQELGIAPDTFVFGSVGRLNEVKQYHFMIQALKQLRDQHLDTHLLLVGDGPERAALQQLASDLQVADRVTFAGYQPSPERFLDAMDLFALTSRSEGFPVSVLEAWALSKPVIVPAVGALPEMIHHGVNGLLYPVNDLQVFFTQVLQLVADREQTEKLGQAGRRRVEEDFTIQRVTDKYIGVYREVLQSRAGVAA